MGVSFASLALSCYCLYRLWSLNKLRKIFFQAPDGSNLEQVLQALYANLDHLSGQHTALEKKTAAMDEQSQFAVQKVGMVRFNPFGDGGGNFSFTLALLNNHNTGVVITSMHGRQQNRIYTKRIEQGRSEMELTEEEQQAVAQANSVYQIPHTK